LDTLFTSLPAKHSRRHTNITFVNNCAMLCKTQE
jgi:hypothetical protein